MEAKVKTEAAILREYEKVLVIEEVELDKPQEREGPVKMQPL